MKTLDRVVFVVLVLALATVVVLAVVEGISVELVVAYVWLVALFAEWNDGWAGMRRIFAQWRRQARCVRSRAEGLSQGTLSR